MSDPLPESQISTDPRPPFRDLTLWQVGRLWLRRPGPTMGRFFAEISLPIDNTPRPFDSEGVDLPPDLLPPEPAPPTTDSSRLENPPLEGVEESDEQWLSDQERQEAGITALLFFPIIFLAMIGGNRLWVAATSPQAQLIGDYKGAPLWFFLAGLLYISLALFQSRVWWAKLIEKFTTSPNPENSIESSNFPQTDSMNTVPTNSEMDSESPKAENTPLAEPPLSLSFDTVFDFFERHWIRLGLIPIGLILTFLAYTQNVITDANNQVTDVAFTRNGGLAWGLSIVIWFGILGLDLNQAAFGFFRLLVGESKPSFSARFPRFRWYHGLFIAILGLGLAIRLAHFSDVPPDMTSDHIEKLLDAKRVYEGYEGIFFPNNGGREPFQMYFLAALVKFGGVKFSFETLKLATVIEGMATLALSLWLGMTIIGQKTREDRQFGIWLGLSFAALLAISSWHVMLSRLGLRIVLTPFTTILMLIFLIRAMRDNRRLDYVWTGLILGVGMYFYQSNRMLPLVATAGIAVAAIVYSRSTGDVLRYGLNFAAMTLMAVIIFVPMYRYGQEFPDDFWNRTRGRLFGEEAFIAINPATGVMEAYEPSLGEQADEFIQHIDQFQTNYENALKMWSWAGDKMWINNGTQQRPAFDPYTDGLFLIGLIGWAMLIFKKWDMAHLVVGLGIVIMLLPSAMAVAYPNENPSFTRASGTIPFVFLIAAYPLAQWAHAIQKANRSKLIGIGLVISLTLPIIALAGKVNYHNYFTDYREGYSNSWKPYRAFAEPIQTFAENEGSYGNAFMIAYPHWLDHRILGTMAGDINWNNGLVYREDVFAVVQRNSGTPYQYDPTKPTLFIYNAADIDTQRWLHKVLPNGEDRIVEVPNRPELTFFVYIAPPNQDWEAIRANITP